MEQRVHRGYTREQEEEYGLVFNFRASAEGQRRSIQKGVEILSAPEERGKWLEKGKRMVGEKEELTAFLVNYVDTVLGFERG